MTIPTVTRKRVVIYCRISQSDDAVGVERQEKLVRAICAKHPDWDVILVLVDNNRSAKEDDLSKRPDYTTLLKMIGNGEVDVLASYHADRISRNGEVVERFLTLARKHKLIFQGYRGGWLELWTADGQKAFRNLSSEAIYESAHKGERVRDRIEEQEAEGMLHGGFRPYGVHRASKTLKDEDGNLLPTEDENGNRIPQYCPSCSKEMKVTLRGGAIRAVVEACPVEQERIRWFAEQWTQGTSTLYGMASHANSEGWPTVRGGTWRPGTIKTILKNGVTHGQRNGNETIVGALLPAELQESLKVVVATPRPRRKQTTPTLLGGLEILKCGICGANMQACQKNKGSLRYGCIKAPGRDHHCGRISIMREKCDDTVRDKLLPALKIWREEGTTSDLQHAEKDLEQAQKDLQKANFDYRLRQPVEDRLTEEEYLPLRTELRQRIKDLEGKVAAAAANTDDIPNYKTGTPEEWLAWWNGISRDRKRKILKGMIARVEVYPSPAGRVYNPRRVHVVYGSWADPIRELIMSRMPKASEMFEKLKRSGLMKKGVFKKP